jgi:hypothetical protein
MRKRRDVMKTVDHLILASFVLCPMRANENGRRSSQIARTAPFAFRKIVKYSQATLYSVIATHCAWLERHGYLLRSGTQQHRFMIPYRTKMPEERIYESPMFRPTESGLLVALSLVDPAELEPYDNRKQRTVAGDYEFSRSFLRSLGLTL